MGYLPASILLCNYFTQAYDEADGPFESLFSQLNANTGFNLDTKQKLREDYYRIKSSGNLQEKNKWIMTAMIAMYSDALRAESGFYAERNAARNDSRGGNLV